MDAPGRDRSAVLNKEGALWNLGILATIGNLLQATFDDARVHFTVVGFGYPFEGHWYLRSAMVTILY